MDNTEKTKFSLNGNIIIDDFHLDRLEIFYINGGSIDEASSMLQEEFNIKPSCALFIIKFL